MFLPIAVTSQYAFYWNDDDRRVNSRRIDNQYIYPECRLRVYTLHDTTLIIINIYVVL